MMWVRKLVLGIAGPLALALVSLPAAAAEGLRLESVDFTTLAGDQLRLDLNLNGPAPTPTVFHTDKPARIALDFPNVSNGLGSKAIAVDTGLAHSVNAVEAQGRTRVVVNLLSLARYDVATEGSHVYLTLHGTAPTAASAKRPGKDLLPARGGAGLAGQSLRNVDFMRGDKGEGRVLIALSDANAVADMHREGGKIVVYIPGASVPAELEKKLDVVDFATPVRSIETQGEAGRAKLTVTPTSEDYDYSSYQTDNMLTIEFRALSRAEREERQKKEAAYGGEKLTLNFQDIPVRQVLQILADFTGLNMVASDTVQGNVTLRLNDVPWDQALDIVLKSKGLAKRQEGNVVRIGPAAEVAKLEKEELAANREVENLEPLRTELISVKYADAQKLKDVLVSASAKSGASATDPFATPDAYAAQGAAATSNAAESAGQPVLSTRGTVTVDSRTNMLVVRDTAGNIDRIRQLVAQLDVAVRQVLIESRIVIADDSFTRDLGVKFSQVSGGSKSSVTNTPPSVTFGASPANGSSQALMGSLLDLAAANPKAKIGFTILRAAGAMLDLELSAGQTEGLTETLSNPRLLTSDGTKAVIKQGSQIPVASVSASAGAGLVSFTYKDVLLVLEVTPHIAPDDNVMLQLKVTKDDADFANAQTTANGTQGVPVNKREVQTDVQVRDGDTVVLGGVYEDTKSTNMDGVPFLSDIPYVGRAFQREHTQNRKRELLVFVTPRIVRQDLAQAP